MNAPFIYSVIQTLFRFAARKLGFYMDSNKENLNEDNLDKIERGAGAPGATLTLDEICDMRLSSFPTKYHFWNKSTPGARLHDRRRIWIPLPQMTQAEWDRKF